MTRLGRRNPQQHPDILGCAEVEGTQHKLLSSDLGRNSPSLGVPACPIPPGAAPVPIPGAVKTFRFSSIILFSPHFSSILLISHFFLFSSLLFSSWGCAVVDWQESEMRKQRWKLSARGKSVGIELICFYFSFFKGQLEDDATKMFCDV